MKKVKGMLVVGVVSALILAGCSGEKEETEEKEPVDKKVDTGEVENKDEPKTEVVETKDALKIGESIDVDGLGITLNSVRYEEGGEFDEPDNRKYIVVNLTAENTSEEEKIVSSMVSVEFKDSEGYTYTQSILLEGLEGHFDGTLEPGGKLRGEIAYDVGSSEYYEVSYMEPFTSGKEVWKFTESEIE